MSIKIKKNNLLITAIIVLWLIAWISEPGVGAIHSASDISNSVHKIIARAIISLIILFRFLNHSFFNRFIRKSALFLVFILWNAATLPLSANLFYSISRLLEFSLMLSSCFLIADLTTKNSNYEETFRLVFGIFLIHIAIAVILFFVSPEWGAKMSGFNKETGIMTYRFGGAFLRLDLVASMAGCMAFYWLFVTDPKLPKIVLYVGLVLSVLALILAHSRSSLITATLIYFAFYAVKKNKNPILLVIFMATIFAVLATYRFEILEFYTRGESVENVMTGSGRSYLFNTLIDLNSWYNIILGNGYLMNWPGGLYFPVQEMNTDMASPHNGYMSILLGSGIFGLLIVFYINIRLINNLIILRKNKSYAAYDWMLPAALYLVITTIADYGIWGVVSPALLLFMLIYFVSENLVSGINKKNENSSFHTR